MPGWGKAGKEAKAERLEKEAVQEDLVLRLRKRADIRRNIPTRKSVQNGERDRIADLLDEAADRIESLEKDQK